MALDNLLSRAVIEDERLNRDEAHLCLGFPYPYETDHVANSFVYLDESDPVTYSFLYPYETDEDENNSLSSYSPNETREVENKTKSTPDSQFQGGDMLSRMTVGSLGLESYGFSTLESLLNTLSVRSLGLEEFGFIDED